MKQRLWPVLVVVLVSMVALTGWWVARASAASSTPVVYVATGENFPDALGAASAAAVQAGPVLLVQKNAIPAVTAAELQRLSPDVIYVAGGTAVVSNTVFNQLKAYAPTVIRVAGANRYATAVEVSKSAFPVGGSASLEARVAALEAQVAALQATLSGVTRQGNTLVFTGMNLQVVNGKGSTDTTNGLGNVIIGYNEKRSQAPSGYRNGSHYLIIGPKHSYMSYGGIVAGYGNTAAGTYASVSGGAGNSAVGDYASVSGGTENAAAGNYASVSGGANSIVSGNYASVSGGAANSVTADYASVSGGAGNSATGSAASVSGGYKNTAAGESASVSGGTRNTAGGKEASVSGGASNTAGGPTASVSGGIWNTASGDQSSVSGGASNTASGEFTSVSGGASNVADSKWSSILGGDSITINSVAHGTYPYCGC